MKRVLSIILSLTLLLPVFSTGAYAIEPETSPNSTSMTVDTFIERYVNNIPSEIDCVATANTSSVEKPSIEYSNIVYDPSTRELSFEATITSNGTATDFSAEGTLYSSYKADYGTNSIVGDLKDRTNQYDILRFEIYNDTDLSRLYGINTPSTATTPTLILYLLDGNNLFLFETQIPSEMSTIAIPNIPANKTEEGAIDGFWFQELVAPTINMIEGTALEDITIGEVASPLAEDSGEETKAVSATWTISGVTYRYHAITKVTYSFVDVDTGDNTWDLTFSIDDAYSFVNGERNSLTGLRITNVNMSMASGPYTRMLRTLSDFNLQDSSTGGTDASRLLGSASVIAGATSANAVGVTVDILSQVLNKTLSSNTLTHNCITLLNSSGNDVYGRAFRYHVPSRYFLQYTDNNVSFQVVTRASSFMQSTGTSGPRTGIIEVNFDYYAGSSSTLYSARYDRITGSYYCDLS